MLVLRLLLFTGFLVVVLRAEDPASDLEDDDDEDFKDPDGGVSDDADDDAMIKDDEPQEQEELLVPRARPLYSPPEARGNVFFTDAFVSEEDFHKKWILSRAKKDAVDDAVAKYDGRWSVEEPSDNPLQQDLGLVLKSRAKHHAIAALLDKPFKFTGKQFVVQYEVKLQNGLDCGGAYIKLLSQDSRLDLTNVHDKTPYTIMFGPDKCGNDHKLHFIFRHKNPVKGTFEEKHAKKPTASLDSYFTDKKTHLYTLVVDSENKFEVYVDQNLINSGSLLSDMNPPINPPKEISDPSDKKPADWDERGGFLILMQRSQMIGMRVLQR
jgi:calnexin